MKKGFLQWLDDHNINYRKCLIIIYVVFVMIPVLIYMSSKEVGTEILTKTVASILLLVFFIAFFIYDQKKKVSEDWGIRGMSATFDGYSGLSDIFKYSKNIKILASRDLDKIYSLIENNQLNINCRYDLLLFNPYCKYAEVLGYGDEYASQVEEIEDFVRDFKSEINIKYYSRMPLDNIIIADDNVYVFPQTQRLSDGRYFVRRFKGNKKGVVYYNGIFTNAWEHPVYEETEADYGK